MQSGHLLHNLYRIQKPLCTGGFGETYLALEENSDYPIQRKMVIKHLKPQANDPEVLKIAQNLFKKEAETLAELGDLTDRIPTLYAYFEEEGEFYLAQEFIEGKTLTEELENRQLSEAQTIEILAEILSALKVVHDKDMIHRDIKPDNIIRRVRDNKLVLIDFGAVKKAVCPAANLQGTRSIGIGTPGYIPYEQGIGHPRLASDLYAVGAIALQCLTGKHPHDLLDKDTLEFNWRHLCVVSDRLANILDKMVASCHLDRYANAAEVKKTLDDLLAISVDFQSFDSQIFSKSQYILPVRSSIKTAKPASFLQLLSIHTAIFGVIGSIGLYLILPILSDAQELAEKIISPTAPEILLLSPQTSSPTVSSLSPVDPESTSPSLEPKLNSLMQASLKPVFSVANLPYNTNFTSEKKVDLVSVQTDLVRIQSEIELDNMAQARLHLKEFNLIWPVIKLALKDKANSQNYQTIQTGLNMVETEIRSATPDRTKATEGIKKAITGMGLMFVHSL